MRGFCVCLLLALSSRAQPLSIGVKGAMLPIGDLVGYWGRSESRPYLVGPFVEVRLPHRLAFECDALYHRFGYSSTTSDILGGVNTERVRANSWTFPILGKYRFSLHGIRPYALLGYAPRRTTGTYADSGYWRDYTGAPTLVRFSGSVSYDTGHALVTGGGIETGAGRLRLSPEVRYLRWKDPLFTEYGSHGVYLSAPQNEVQLVLGIAWSGR